MNFKDQLDRDISAVFHNSAEFADVLEFVYDGNQYEGPVILDNCEVSDRKTTVHDHVVGISLSMKKMYIPFSLLQVVPKKGKYIEIGDETYTIAEVQNEAGEIVLYLEMFDE